MDKTLQNNHWLTRDDNSWKYGEGRQPSEWELSREQTLVDFIGEERRASVFADLRPEPCSAAELVKAWLAEQTPETIKLQEHLDAHWEEAIGHDNAAYCKLQGIEGETAVLEVQKSIFLYALTQTKPYLERHLEEFTAGAVRKIRLTLAGASWSRHSRKDQAK
jgi:hypothetical protein